MELPQAPNPTASSVESLIRSVKLAYEAACAACEPAEIETLESGTVYLIGEPEAEGRLCGVFNVRSPADQSVEAGIHEIETRFRATEADYGFWIPNDRDPDPQLITGFLANEFSPHVITLMQMIQSDTGSESMADMSLQVVPARSIRREYLAIHRSSGLMSDADPSAQDRYAQFKVDTLDDPRIDALCARIGGEIVACASVYVHGDIGILKDGLTRSDQRRRGIMRSLLTRLLEHCARSQLRTIVAPVESGNEAGLQLLQSIGMREIVTFPVFVRDRWPFG